jgi:hypothetical protein
VVIPSLFPKVNWYLHKLAGHPANSFQLKALHDLHQSRSATGFRQNWIVFQATRSNFFATADFVDKGTACGETAAMTETLTATPLDQLRRPKWLSAHAPFCLW